MFVLPSTHDERNYIYLNCITGAAAESSLPTKYKSTYTRVENQGTSNHCVAHAFTTGMEIKEMMVQNTRNVPDLSRLFLQSECKLIDGYSSAEGTTMIAALKVLQKIGVCEESLYPWVFNENIKKNIFPTKEGKLYDNAKKYRIASYAQMGRNVEDIKRAIYNEGCAFVSNRCFDNYAKSYKGHTYPPVGSYAGNHATCFIGWDDQHECEYGGTKYKGFFIRLNSYGDKYYANGEEYVPYEAITSWKVDYDVDRWFVEAWTAISAEKLSNPDYHKLVSPTEVILPKYTEIILTIGSQKAIVNGAYKNLSVAPVLKEGTTFLPIRFFTESISNVYCEWRDRTQEVVVLETNNKKTYIFKIGSVHVTDSSGKVIYTLLTPPFIKDGSTLLPVRAFTELLGAQVDYHVATKEIIIKY